MPRALHAFVFLFGSAVGLAPPLALRVAPPSRSPQLRGGAPATHAAASEAISTPRQAPRLRGSEGASPSISQKDALLGITSPTVAGVPTAARVPTGASAGSFLFDPQRVGPYKVNFRIAQSPSASSDVSHPTLASFAANWKLSLGVLLVLTSALGIMRGRQWRAAAENVSSATVMTTVDCLGVELVSATDQVESDAAKFTGEAIIAATSRPTCPGAFQNVGAARNVHLDTDINMLGNSGQADVSMPGNSGCVEAMFDHSSIAAPTKLAALPGLRNSGHCTEDMLDQGLVAAPTKLTAISDLRDAITTPSWGSMFSRASTARFVGSCRHRARRGRRAAATMRAARRHVGAKLRARVVVRSVAVSFDSSRIRTKIQLGSQITANRATTKNREAVETVISTVEPLFMIDTGEQKWLLF